jgi:hypothetical protein
VGLLSYRAIGDERDAPYPAWLRRLQKSNGAYVVRAKDGGRVLYVGESHSGNLYKTITRHFSGWSRAKKWWSGIFGQQHDPGTSYERGDVEVAVHVTRTGPAAIEVQNRLIKRLKPADNIVGAVEEAPF